MSRDWVILLEAAAEHGAPHLELHALEALLGCLADFAPTALYAPDRYAVQLRVAAVDPADALDSATASWRIAARGAGVPRWPLVRVEIKTPEELEAERRAEERTTPMPQADTSALQAAYRATRALVAATSLDDISAALSVLVHDLGGLVRPASYRDPDAIPVDLTLGQGPAMVPVIERLSVARLQLEEVLPVVLEDARAVANKLRRRELGAVKTPA
jgi:hypothetical protein